MKYNKIAIFAALAALVAAAACQREIGVEVPEEELGPVFAAKLGQPTRSHFNDADEGTPLAGTLYWDVTDRVAIASAFQMDDATSFSDRINEHLEELAEGVFEEGVNPHYAYQSLGYLGAYIGKPVTKYMVTSSAMVNIHADDQTWATLRPARTGAEWFANANEAVGDPLYEFLAIYPVSEGDLQPLKFLYFQGSMGCVGYPMTVAHEQDGVHFGEYHVCMDSGLAWDSDALMGVTGLHYMSKVLSRQESIVFSKLDPITSLLRFRMKINSTTPASIAKLVITLEDDEDVLSGASWASAWGEACWLIPDRWTEDNNFKDVVINFRYPVSVSSTPSDPYYAVVLPSFASIPDSAPIAANLYENVTIRFDAYDYGNNLLYTTTKTAPTTGFIPGGRYDFTLVLDGSVPDDGFQLTVNAGGYQDGGNPFVQE